MKRVANCAALAMSVTARSGFCPQSCASQAMP
jgi:hypothetical protein